MQTLFVNGKKIKIKMKKNAMEPVDFEEEKKKDPKYKTELCKSWIEKGYCVYGFKCRFAHGEEELVAKTTTVTNYKKKPCKSFFERGFCPYGSRCNYKHEERKISDIKMPYYFINLFMKNKIVPGKRLKVFQDITNEHKKKKTKEKESSSGSTSSNEDYTKENSEKDSPKNYSDSNLLKKCCCSNISYSNTTTSNSNVSKDSLSLSNNFYLPQELFL